MRHSAIICTRNRATDIIYCLASIAQQVKSFDEVIVVDSSDTPLNTLPAFNNLFSEQQFGKTKMLYIHTATGLPYQRNCGIKKATGDIIYFFDDDATLLPDYLEQMASAFQKHPECAGGMGEICNIPPQSQWSYYFHRFFGLHGKQSSGDFTLAGMTKQAYGADNFRLVQSLNGCAAYRREIFKKHVFDDCLPGRAALEDADMSWRVSQDCKLFFTPAAKLRHVPSIDARESMQQFHREHMRNYSYFFFKNVWPTGRCKIIAYIWAVIGLYVHAVLKRDLQEAMGYCQGLHDYFYKGLPAQR